MRNILADESRSAPESISKPLKPELAIAKTRQLFSDAFELVPSESSLAPIDPDCLLMAIDTLGRLLRRQCLSPDEIRTAQSSMKALGIYENAVEAFGLDGIRRYFKLLSGPDSDHPYFLAIPLFDDDLESYWFYDVCHDDAPYQDQVILGHIDDSVETVGVNLLISRMKQNPDFGITLERDSRFQKMDLLFQKAGRGPLLKYIFHEVHSAAESNEEKMRSPGFDKATVQDQPWIPLRKASAALSYLFNKERTKKVHKYENNLKKGDLRFAAKIREEICAKDFERFRQISEMIED